MCTTTSKCFASVEQLAKAAGTTISNLESPKQASYKMVLEKDIAKLERNSDPIFVSFISLTPKVHRGNMRHTKRPVFSITA